MKYNIIDTQLGDYYEENISLAEAKEHAIRIMERAIEEDDPRYYKKNKAYLMQLHHASTLTEIKQWLAWFDYELEEVGEKNIQELEKETL